MQVSIPRAYLEKALLENGDDIFVIFSPRTNVMAFGRKKVRPDRSEILISAKMPEEGDLAIELIGYTPKPGAAIHVQQIPFS